MELYVIVSEDPRCCNPMGIYDTFEYAKIYCDKLFDTDSIKAYVCSYILNEPTPCKGHTLVYLYENGKDESEDYSLISHLKYLMK